MDAVEKAVKAIVSDIEERRGIGNEWDAIDSDIQKEIKKEWAKIIRNHLGITKSDGWVSDHLM